MKTTITTLIFLNLFFLSFGQITFQKIIEANKWNSGEKVINTYDNKFMLVCTVNTTKDDQILLVKANKYGNIEWKKYYGENYRVTPIGEIIETKDHGFIITGRAKERNSNSEWNIYILKIDEFGNIIWEKTIKMPEYMESHSIIQDSDNKFLILGSKYNTEEKKFQTFLAKLDDDGDTIWLQTYFSNSNGSVGNSILELTKSEYLILSTIDTGNAFDNSKKINLMKVDTVGNHIWSNTFQDSTLGLTAIDMTLAPDDKIVILGQLGYSGTFIKPSIKMLITNLNGEYISSFETEEINYNCKGIYPQEILVQNDRYYIVGSTYDYDNTKVDGFIYVFDKNGTPLNYNYFGGNDVESFNSFCKSDDYGFAVTGRTYSYGSRENYGDIFFAKIDSSLESSINTISKSKIDTAVCQGDSLVINNEILRGNNTYYDTINMNGYDSVTVVEVSHYPHPFFYISNDTSITTNDTITLKLNNNTSYSSIVWNDSIYQDSLIVLGSFLEPGEHKLWCTLTNEFGCTYTDTVNITITIPSNVISKKLHRLLIYPNPFKDFIIIDSGKLSRKVNIRIIDINGACGYSIENSWLNDKIRIPTGQLNRGLYFLEIYDKETNEMIVTKMLK